MSARPLTVAALLCVAVAIAAQDTKAPATKEAAPVQASPTTKAPTGTKAGAPRQGAAVTIAPADTTRRLPVILREVFEYTSEGRRDPFVSLLMSAELRPTIADLRLVGVLFDETGRRPVAVMRDVQTNTQYRVTTGMTLGRLRVALIGRKKVIFTIEEFGLNRQDSLLLGDTTKARAR